ncbi:MAG TPA: hypothetical protein VLL04_12125, partial [Rhizomicrobium sp.]|nr:hypothetical protein [Rhizomicrobium sp.]
MRAFDRRAMLGAAAALAAMPWRASASVGQITTIAGSGVAGLAADGERAATAAINNPFGVLIGPDGGLYWADFGSNRVMRLDLRTRRIAVIAGTGEKGHAGDGGPAAKALMSTPHEVRFDAAGNMFVAERDAHVVRHIDMKSGVISTVAGTGIRGYSGDGGPAAAAQLAQPHSIALDRDDNLYICDILNNRIRRRDPKTGIITTFAGTGEKGETPDQASLDGTPLLAPRSIDIGPDGTLYLVLREGNKAFTVDPARRTLKRLAGTGAMGYAGDGGPALAAQFRGPKGVALSSDGSLYIADTENHVSRRIALAMEINSTVAGTGDRGYGPTGDALACKLNRAHDLFVQGR